MYQPKRDQILRMDDYGFSRQWIATAMREDIAVINEVVTGEPTQHDLDRAAKDMARRRPTKRTQDQHNDIVRAVFGTLGENTREKKKDVTSRF